MSTFWVCSANVASLIGLSKRTYKIWLNSSGTDSAFPSISSVAVFISYTFYSSLCTITLSTSTSCLGRKIWQPRKLEGQRLEATKATRRLSWEVSSIHWDMRLFKCSTKAWVNTSVILATMSTCSTSGGLLWWRSFTWRSVLIGGTVSWSWFWSFFWLLDVLSTSSESSNSALLL